MLAVIFGIFESAHGIVIHVLAEDAVYATGCIPDSWETLQAKHKSNGSPSALPEAALPSSLDNSSKYPPPKSQGQQGSCVAWAVGYYYKTYQDNLDHGWDIDSDSCRFSPAYIYNQIHVGQDEGSYISDALDLLVSQGVCSMADMPYNEYNYTMNPTAEQKAKAYPHRSTDWNWVQGNSNIKSKIYETGGCIVSIDVYSNFENLGSNIYKDYIGSYTGRHAICLIGWDDSKGAYKFVNSWGSYWGINGYGWIAYSLFDNSERPQAYYMYDYAEPKNTKDVGSRSVSGDFNGDGKGDYATLYDYGNGKCKWHVFISTGTKFSEETWWEELHDGWYYASNVSGRVVAGDFNGDGKDDICAIYDYTNEVNKFHVWLSDGTKFNGIYDWNTKTQYDAKMITGRVVAGDFNGDGKDDIAAMYDYGKSTAKMHVFISSGSSFAWYEGVWWEEVHEGWYAATNVTDRMVAGDFNGDGKDDICAIYDYANGVNNFHVWLSNGTKFSNIYDWKANTQYDAKMITGRVVAGDFNGDGKDDIAAMYDYGKSTAKMHVFMSSGSKFDNCRSWWEEMHEGWYAAPNVAGRMVAGDFNGDRKCDIVTMYDYESSHVIFHLWLSNGNTFNTAWWNDIHGYNAKRTTGMQIYNDDYYQNFYFTKLTRTRFQGNNRVSTANTIATQGWPTGSNTVILASGASFADALAAAPLAAHYNAPILLTSSKTTLEDSVLSTINTLKAKRIIIIGGASSVSNDIYAYLAPRFQTQRLAGGSRYTTAIAVAKALKADGVNFTSAFLADGTNFPDALSVSPVAGILQQPILFTNKGDAAKVNTDTGAYIQSLGIKTVNIVGGGISDTVADNLKSAYGVTSTKRLSGGNRYTTAVAINAKYKSIFTGNAVTLTTGANYPDALAGSAYAAKIGAPLFLLQNGQAFGDVKAAIQGIAPANVYIFGGAVDDTTVNNHI
ncbi:MAG: cell wall-binding repeat-containing protein [Oscillospiraceae bacterium]|nr:cell wall-binding repeat-containing protein [Oscillospiraceae bacterium]